MHSQDEHHSNNGTLNRRNFLRTGVTAGVAAAAFPALGGSGELLVSNPASPGVKPFELDEATIVDLQDGMKIGKYTARSLVQSIARVSRQSIRRVQR